MKIGTCRGLDDFAAIKDAAEAGVDYYECGFGNLVNLDEEKFQICKTKNPKELESNEEYQLATGKVMAYQTFLQELVDDPRLLSDSDSNMAKQYVSDNIQPSEKMITLINLLEEIIRRDNNV